MKIKSLLSIAVSSLLAASVLLTIGCGGDGGGNDTASSTTEIAALEAKANQGDAAAAYKVGEIYAQDSEKNASMVAALKWFRIAQKLGNTDASLAIQTLEKGATPEQMMEALQKAEAFTVPAK
jgi:TPR repeat protein